MNSAEIHHLLFRWLHVLFAVLWIGHLWSLIFVQRAHPDKPDAWLRNAGVGTVLTGGSLLIVVYYAGGALTTPEQSWRVALAAGLAAVFLTWPIYDVLWRVLAASPIAALAISLAGVGAIAQGLSRVMTGRAAFIHLGAMLATVMFNNVMQRPHRLAHNAMMAPAVLLFMISNHFPLIYGGGAPWLAAPLLLSLGVAMGYLLGLVGRPRQPSSASR